MPLVPETLNAGEGSGCRPVRTVLGKREFICLFFRARGQKKKLRKNHQDSKVSKAYPENALREKILKTSRWTGTGT